MYNDICKGFACICLRIVMSVWRLMTNIVIFVKNRFPHHSTPFKFTVCEINYSRDDFESFCANVLCRPVMLLSNYIVLSRKQKACDSEIRKRKKRSSDTDVELCKKIRYKRLPQSPDFCASYSNLEIIMFIVVLQMYRLPLNEFDL